MQHMTSCINKIATTNIIHHKHKQLNVCTLKLIHTHLRHDKCQDNPQKEKFISNGVLYNTHDIEMMAARQKQYKLLTNKVSRKLSNVILTQSKKHIYILEHIITI